jgi:hypothetical protein
MRTGKTCFKGVTLDKIPERGEDEGMKLLPSKPADALLEMKYGNQSCHAQHQH